MTLQALTRAQSHIYGTVIVIFIIIIIIKISFNRRTGGVSVSHYGSCLFVFVVKYVSSLFLKMLSDLAVTTS